MGRVADWIMTNWIAVIGLTGTFYFGVFGRAKSKRKLLCISNRYTTTVNDHGVVGLELSFRQYGKKLSRIIVKEILIKNVGEALIERSDLAPTKSIEFKLSDGELIDCNLVKVSHSNNQFSITRRQDRSGFTLSFDHIDSSDGCVIQVVSSGFEAIKTTSTLKGGEIVTEKPNRRRILRRIFANDSIFIALVAITLWLSMSAFIFSVDYALSDYMEVTNPSMYVSVWFICLSITIPVASVALASSVFGLFSELFLIGNSLPRKIRQLEVEEHTLWQKPS